MSTDTANCLCGSSLTYQQCCALLHSEQTDALTAALMRSRFTAYAMHNDDYLLKTWDVSTRPTEVDFSKDTGEWTR